MASQQSTVDYIIAQMSGAGVITAKKMFGEYGVYCGEKIIGVVCDDLLFVKPTAEGVEFANDLEHAAPYPGAKPSLLVSKEKLKDSDWLSQLIKITFAALPIPKKRKKKKK